MPERFELPVFVRIVRDGARQPEAEAATRDAFLGWARERGLDAEVRKGPLGLTVYVVGTDAELRRFATDAFLTLRRSEPVGDA